MKYVLFLILSTLAFAEAANDDTPPQSQWTFQHSKKRDAFTTGLIKHRAEGEKDARFATADIKLPRRFHLRDHYKLSPILNQGSCGSCVVFSVIKNLQDSYIIHGKELPPLSKQYVMDCGRQGSCNGSWFTTTAKAIQTLGGTAKEEAYPYKARNQSCKGADEIIGKIDSYRLIDESPKSIMTALYQRYPVSVTVGAGGAFMGYDSGIYNACSNVGTNHEVLIYGWDCEESFYVEDGKEYCKLDSNGKLPNGVGFWYMPNSWGTGFASGESNPGEMRIKMTSSSGRLCNNIAEEAGILELGFPVPTPTPSPTPSPTPGPTPNGPSNWIYAAIALGLAVVATVVGFIFKKK